MWILEEAEIKVYWSDFSLFGYDCSASLRVWKDNDFLTVGSIAYAEEGSHEGGLFELTGKGCQLFQVEYPGLWDELHDVLNEVKCPHEQIGWRIARVDMALDCVGEFALAHQITVPRLYKLGNFEGFFKSDLARNPLMSQTFTPVGDWSDFINGVLTPEEYDPLKHAPLGLTGYVGVRKSADDFIRFYEKGKQLLGKDAEPISADRAWVRIEHEMSRKSTGREIPFDVLLNSDHYFCANRSRVRQIMNDLRAFFFLADTASWKRKLFSREKMLMISKKIHYARHAYGRLIRTMVEDLALSPLVIVNTLIRSQSLKEFVLDVDDDESAFSHLSFN